MDCLLGQKGRITDIFLCAAVAGFADGIENIKYTVLVQSVQLNRVVFSYYEDIIMEFELNEYSSKEIDMQVLIDELIENYRIIV